MKEEKSKSEEELLAEEESAEVTSEEEVIDETKEEEVEEESEEEASIPLSDHTRTKDVLHRIADRILEDEDKLAELAEDDPKLLERLRKEFPKKFKDVVVSKKSISEEDIEERVQAAVAKELKSLGKSDVVDSLREELDMTKMEFEDIKKSITDKANRLIELELADSYKDAVLLAFKDINPRKYKTIIAKQVAKENSEKYTKSTSGKSSSTTKEFSKNVLENYKKYGFDSPEQMVDYQSKDKMIPLHR